MSTRQMFTRLGLFGVVVLALAVPKSEGVTIGFEGTGVAPNGVISPVPLPYNEAGFTIRNGTPAAESGIFGADTDGESNSGSDFLGWAFNGNIVLEKSDAAPFTLTSFDAGHIGAIGGLPAVLPLQVTGNLQGGGTVVANFNYTVPWATFNLPGTFTGLSSVEFLTSFDGGAGIDNIVVNAVPEHGESLTLLLAAALGLVWLNAARARNV